MAKKTAAKKSTVKKTPAKKRRVNKSQAIRDYLEKSKETRTKDIVAALAGRGIEVSPQQVSSERTKMFGPAKPGVKKRAKKAAGPSSGKPDSVEVEALLQAKKFAGRVGGVEDAKKLLDTLEKLKD